MNATLTNFPSCLSVNALRAHLIVGLKQLHFISFDRGVARTVVMYLNETVSFTEAHSAAWG